ncbi:MAG: phospho-N-acetylmuramoyl-pentapeptide-transferase [Simkaniaceae bacterium]|nr:phospho-N-acetylmuramoyl-pentapeptide-transferase [Simkaniaceae bacterium]
MILLFLNFLSAHFFFKVPSVFYYSSSRMILAAITTLLFTVCLGQRFIKKLYELKVGQPIRMEECPVLAQLHEKKQDTPTMGGILILVSMLVALVLWMDLTSSFTLILFIATVWLGFIGAVDDFLKLKYKSAKGLSGKKKMAFQILFAAAFSLYLLVPRESSNKEVFSSPVAKEQITIAQGENVPPETFIRTLKGEEYAGRYYVPFFKKPLLILTGGGCILAFFITLFVITGSSNAVNLTDGLDGLAAGCVLQVSIVLAVVAFLSNHFELSSYLNILYIEGSGEIGVYLCAMVGACLGFLWYNGYPAQVFMGDTGSLALGGILGVCSVLLRREGLLALVGGIFVVEALSVIIQVLSYKLRGKKRVFLCAPLHHHFEYKGWQETKVVVRFWIVGLVLALIGLFSFKFQ